MYSRHAGILMQVALAFAVALMAAPVVRTVTFELNNTVGRAWPFALARCQSAATPGCSGQPVQSAGQTHLPVRTGHL